MKTTHELAAELMALPNVPVVVELWMRRYGYAPLAKMTGYDPDGTAIIMQVEEQSYEEIRISPRINRPTQPVGGTQP